MAVNPRTLTWLLRGGVIAVAVYYGVWGGEYSVWDLRSLRQEMEEQTERLARSRAETDSLRKLARALERDPDAIERVARERFGMIREGETLIRFVEAPAAANADAP